MISLIRHWLFNIPFKHRDPITEFEPFHLIKYINNSKIVSLRQIDKLSAMIRSGRPISQVLRIHPFLNLRLKVNSKILIPRTETEYLVHELIGVIKKYRKNGDSLRILDVGTGTGCIGIALAANLANVHVDLLDVSSYSQKCAQLNVFGHRSQIEHLGSSVNFVKANFLHQNIYDSYDMIISNPPYIPAWRLNKVQPSVLMHEPSLALFDRANINPSGLSFHEKILSNARSLLKNSLYCGPKIVLEFEAPYQAKRLGRLALSYGFSKWKFIADQFQVKRFLFIY